MEIKFLKLESCGNDYLILEGLKNPLLKEELYPELAREMLKRTTGVGAKGLILALKDKQAALFVRLFSETGAELEVDPEALRCLGRYAVDAGFLGKELNRVRTSTGSYILSPIDTQNISVELPPPLFSHTAEEIREDPNLNLCTSLVFQQQRYTYSTLNLGGLQAVFAVDDFNFPFIKLCKTLSAQQELKNTTLINFVQIYGREVARIRTWHKEKGECRSSGLGAAAAVVASVLNGFLDRETLIHTRGGDIYVNWEMNNNHLYVTGPVTYVFTGTYYSS